MTYQNFGLKFDPFAHLDSTKDARLYEYLVIPRAVEIAWGDKPTAIFAKPGGGKSALRTYTELVYRGTRGVKLPITYVPDTYSSEPDFHFFGLSQSLARAVMIYLISYPDIFLQFSSTRQAETKHLLIHLPYELNFILDILAKAQSTAEIEQLFGVRAISGIEKLGKAHQEMIRLLRCNQVAKTGETNIITLMTQAKEIFEIASFHILVDGLDGFIETAEKRSLLKWIAPLLNIADSWAQQHIYIKLFLPLTISDFPEIHTCAYMQTASLDWDDGLLAEVIRRRLYVASNGSFDSLDALSTPDLHNVELHLARQLDAEKKLPRQIIIKAHALLKQAQKNPDLAIHYENLFREEIRHVA